MKTYDPIEYDCYGVEGRGQMKENPEGDWVRLEDAKALEAERDALKIGITSASLCCPFCGENGFDRCGLKVHISREWCPEYEAIAPPKPPRLTPIELPGGAVVLTDGKPLADEDYISPFSEGNEGKPL